MRTHYLELRPRVVRDALIITLLISTFAALGPDLHGQGTGWSTQSSGVTTVLRSVRALTPSVCWMSGDNGVVLRTTNGGASWARVGGGAIGTQNIFALAAIDEQIALVASTSRIYRTTDGGSNWTLVFTQPGGFLDAFHMFDAANGIAVGDPVGGKWTILRTSDGGSSWNRIATEPDQVGGEAGWVNCLQVIGTSHIWFGSHNSRIYRSTDGGATWSSGQTPSTSCSSLWFNDTLYGVAGFTTGPAARTTDGGISWIPIDLPGTARTYGVAGAGKNDFWISKGPTVFRSTDRGNTWSPEYASVIGNALRHVQMATQGQTTSGWLGSESGGIAFFQGTMTNVGRDPEGAPASFRLSQNYPNPFNPSTKIQFTLPHKSRVTVVIYDLLGNEVTTLVDGQYEPGISAATWDGKDNVGNRVSSNVYFYKMTATPADGSAIFSSVRRMILLK
jgi:photosystem II stability/assembly factor-like uncharacterized protein